MYTLCVWINLRKNSRNLESWVIIGPLWVKYWGKIACQPPAAQNPGHAPESYYHNELTDHIYWIM